MESNVVSSSRSIFGKLFFLRKKMIAVFIFAAMSVNGFAPSTMELGKFSFVLVLAAASHNAAVTVLSKCRDSLTVMSNSLSGNIFKHIFKFESTQNTPVSKKDNAQKKNSSGDYAVIILQKTLDKKRVSQQRGLGGAYAAYDFSSNYIANVFLFSDGKLYGGGVPILLLFLIFIYAVRHRKGLSEDSITSLRKRIKISA